MGAFRTFCTGWACTEMTGFITGRTKRVSGNIGIIPAFITCIYTCCAFPKVISWIASAAVLKSFILTLSTSFMACTALIELRNVKVTSRNTGLTVIKCSIRAGKTTICTRCANRVTRVSVIISKLSS